MKHERINAYKILMNQIRIEKERIEKEKEIKKLQEDIKKRHRERENFIAWNNMK